MAIIKTQDRPLIKIRDVNAKVPHDALKVSQIAQSVGRLEIDGHPTIPWLGAAFVVGPDLLLTAGHNARTFANPCDDGWVIDPRFEVFIGFGRKLRSGQRGAISKCLLVHPVLDIALLQLSTRAPCRPLILSGAHEINPGQSLITIGYYAQDSRNDPSAIAALGKFRSGEKVVAPGKSIGMSTDRFYKRGASWSLVHDCTTLGGFAGGPVVHLASGAIVGLHFAGVYLDGNFAVPMTELARDNRIRDWGVKFSRGTPGPDPDAFESEYRSSGFVSRKAAEARTAAPVENNLREGAELDAIDQKLGSKFPDLDKALEFIQKFGEEYAQTIKLQPGRSRVTEKEYRRAVIDALNRRGLVSTEFISSLAGPEPILSAETTQQLIDQLRLTVSPRAFGNPIETVIGSPYYDLLLNSDRGIDSLQVLIERLAKEPRGKAGEALAWLIKQYDDGSEEVLQALKQLGETRLEIESIGPPPSDLDMVESSFLMRAQTACRAVCVVFCLRPIPMLGLPGGATGWLVAPDLVVCPAHIAAEAEMDAASMRVEFEDSGPDAPRTVVEVISIESYDNKTDLMILRLVSPQTQRRPLQFDLSRPNSGPILSIHFPDLKQQMISFIGGYILQNDGHTLLYTLATTKGCAGAPILTRALNVLGTHRGFRFVTNRQEEKIRAKFGTSVQALVASLQEGEGKQALWRQIVSSQDALRSVDAKVLAMDENETMAVVIELVDEKFKLPDIEGLSIFWASGEFVTAKVDRKAAVVLTKTQGVVSITSSGTSSNPECTKSLPFIEVPASRNQFNELGDEALVAIIDDGVDPFHKAFWDEDQSCIDVYWDQRGLNANSDPIGSPTQTFSPEAAAFVQQYQLVGGALYLGSDFKNLDESHRAKLREGVLHGTAVASIAVGRKSGDLGQHFGGGVAIKSKLIVVRFDRDGNSIGSSAGHLRALGLIDQRATELNLPVVVNISNGMNSGAHDGSSKVERQCARFVERAGRVVVKSAGNEYGEGRHAQFTISDANPKTLRWISQPTTSPSREGESDEIELWFGTHNKYDLTILDPDGKQSSIFPVGRPLIENLSTLNLLQCTYEPLSSDNRRKARVSIRISPGKKKAVQSGEWKLKIQPKQFRGSDEFHAWIETQKDRTLQFKADVTNNYTITVPGTGSHVITVGAIEPSEERSLYEKSSHGPNSDGIIKPDLVAPGVNISAALTNTDKERMRTPTSGTSFAAPHVTGAIALALSMAQKLSVQSGTTIGALSIEAGWIRQHLINSLDDFNLSGSPERGHGRLNVRNFLTAVHEELLRLTTQSD